MEKAKNNGIFSCISKNGNPKSAWNTSEEVIQKAKKLNLKNSHIDRKLVGYKCPKCFKYHLKTTTKKG